MGLLRKNRLKEVKLFKNLRLIECLHRQVGISYEVHISLFKCDQPSFLIIIYVSICLSFLSTRGLHNHKYASTFPCGPFRSNGVPVLFPVLLPVLQPDALPKFESIKIRGLRTLCDSPRNSRSDGFDKGEEGPSLTP